MKKCIVTIGIVLILSTPLTAQENEYYDVAMSEELQDELFILCDIYEVDAKLILAMIFVESSYIPDVISETNDYGLMQINEINHEWLGEVLGINDFLDPVQNMEAGIYLINQYMQSTDNDIHMSLMIYKYGENGAKRKFNRGITQCGYSRKIIGIMDNLVIKT